MYSMQKTLTIIAAGAVSIGIITAMTLPGRQTAGVISSGGKAVQGVFGTVISGK
jgi:hypothetical protein